MSGDEFQLYAGYIIADGKGGFVGADEFEVYAGYAGSVVEPPTVGTYEVDGFGRFREVEGPLPYTPYGIISPGGEFAVAPDMDPVEDEDLGLSFLVKKPGSPLTVADLSGRYNLIDFYHASPAAEGDEAYTAAGYAVFDGMGGYVSKTEVDTQDPLPSENAGTYGLNTEGRLIVDGFNTYGAVTPSADLLIIPDADPDTISDNELGFTIAVKASAQAAANVDGEYYSVDVYHDTPAAWDTRELVTGAGRVIFDAASGTATVYPEYEAWVQGSNDPVEVHTYSVDPDGRLWIDGEQTYGAVSPSGDVIVVPDLDPVEDSDVGLAILVRRSDI